MKNITLILSFWSIFLTQKLSAQKFKEIPAWQFTIFFETGKFNIDSIYKPKLDSLVIGMIQDTNFHVMITAHTDNTGSTESNELLSKRRAEAIKNYITQKGISENRFKWQWKGESDPVSENDTEGGKAQNRRVVVEVSRRIYLAEVKSVVKNDSGKVVPNAMVMMRSRYVSDSTVTDSVGNFTLNIPYKQPVIIEVAAKKHFFGKQLLNIGFFNLQLRDFILPKVEVGKKIKIQDLNFYGNQATLLPESKPNLKIVLSFMRLNPTYKINILGHVNLLGFPVPKNSQSYELSVARAKTVEQYLLDNGIANDRMNAIGMANWDMLYPNAHHEEQMSKNRRVEIKVVEE